jgi:hypothetical protein
MKATSKRKAVGLVEDDRGVEATLHIAKRGEYLAKKVKK